MSKAPQHSPIAKFLGPESLRGGPFGLLRISPDACTDERIVSSLEWQLDRVAQHAEGDTPEADEVRLALHTAAAQLLDPNVRRYVMESLQQRAASPGAAAATTSHAEGLTGLEQDAIRALAAYGGWNKQSLERLKALAQARGMGSREVALTLQNLASGQRRPAGAAAPRPVSPMAPQQHASARPTNKAAGAPSAASESRLPPSAFADPSAKYVRNLILIVGGVAVALVAVVVVGALVLTSGGQPAPVPTPPQATNSASAPPTSPTPVGKPADSARASADAGKTAPAPAPEKKPRPAPPVQEVVDPQALVRSLSECAALARREPDVAAEKFRPLVRTLAARWCKLDVGQRRAADVSVLDVVFATASHPDVSSRVMEAVREGARRLGATDALQPEETWAAVWSVGILTRLSRERELPHSLSSVIDSELTSSVGQDRPRTSASFEAGALAALRRIPERLLAGDAPDAKNSSAKADELIRPWIEALSAVAGADAELKERMLVDALHRVLTAAGEPSADQRVFDTVQTLVVEIKWRRGGPARARLLDWFKDPHVSMQDLQVVTGALASRSSAEGVDAMMVLSVGAAPSDRQRLRATYAKAWGIAESVGEDKASSGWLEAGKAELARTTEGLRPLELLSMAVTMARLNEAATRLWRGEADKVEDAVDSATAHVTSSSPASSSSTFKTFGQGADGDGQWTASYLSLGRNVALRQEKLSQMERYTTGIGPVDAEQLFYLACYESPIELRLMAQRGVTRLANEPAIVNAALELLPRAPRYASVGTVFETVARRQLPRPTEASWEVEARRALVSRLLELLAASSENAKIDEMSRAIFEAYAVRAGSAGLSETETTGEPGSEQGAQAAADLCRAWRTDAEAVAPNEYAPVPLDAIDRRRQGRLRLAQGPIQVFAAEQVSTAELMAYVVSAEHPRLTKQAKEVIDEMAAARRQSRHIFEQMAYAERAMLQLWRLRIAGDQP